MMFLGCVDDVTEGILASRGGGEEWVLEVNSSVVPHGFVADAAGRPAASNQEEWSQEESRGIPKFAEDAIVDYANDVARDQEESGGVPKYAISPETTYREDPATIINPGPGSDPFEPCPEREVTCPVCLGKHRRHTKHEHCKLGPPPRGIPHHGGVAFTWG